MKRHNFCVLLLFTLIVSCTNSNAKKKSADDKAKRQLEQLLKEGKNVITIYHPDGTVEYVDKEKNPLFIQIEKDKKLLPEGQKELASEMEIPTTFLINIKKVVGKDFKKIGVVNKTGEEISSKMLPRMITLNDISLDQKTKIEDDFRTSPSFFKETIKDNWHCANYGINIYFTKNKDNSYDLIVSKL